MRKNTCDDCVFINRREELVSCSKGHWDIDKEIDTVIVLKMKLGAARYCPDFKEKG